MDPSKRIGFSHPKDGELCLNRAKLEKIPVEACSCSGVKIDLIKFNWAKISIYPFSDRAGQKLGWFKAASALESSTTSGHNRCATI